MKAEELDNRITLQPLTITRGTDGAEIKDYSQNNIDVATKYLAKSGREFYAAQKINAETQAAFKIRYRKGIDTTWRVISETRSYKVIFVDDTGKRQGSLILACKEVV